MRHFAIFIALLALLTGLTFCYMNYFQETTLASLAFIGLVMLWRFAGEMSEMFK